jgi:hypothetical protein
VKVFVATLFTLSVTVTVNVYDPAVVTVPLSVALVRLVPGGVLPVRLNEYGATPPDAVNVTPNVEPACTLLKPPVVMISGAATTVIDTVPDPPLPVESVAVTPKE